MKTSIIQKSALIALIALVVIPTAAFAADLTVGGTDTGGADQSSPTVSGQNTGGADTSSASLTTGGQNTGGADVSATGMTTGGQNTGGADATLTTGGQNSGGADTAPAPVVAPAAPAAGVPISVSSGGSYVSSSSGGSSVVPINVSVTASAAPATAGTNASCPLISTYMKLGGANDGSDVAKLQGFLKSQGFDADVTGTFDQQTQDAVKAFQAKYMSDIMGPWGATQTSGMVYITTEKKINELACNQPLTLNASDMAIINAYQQNAAQSVQNGSAVGSTTDAGTSNANATDTIQVGDTGDQNATVAAVGGASVLQNFWNFVTSLFK